MKILKKMLKRRLNWVDIEKEIYDEDTQRSVTWFGLFTVTSGVDVIHTISDKKDKKVGF